MGDAARLVGNEKTETVLLRKMSALHVKKNEMDLALEAAKAALQISQELQEWEEEAQSLQTIIGVHMANQEYTEAMDAANEMTLVSQHEGKREGEASGLLSLCQVQQRIGQTDEAIASAKEALDIFREVNDEKNQAVVMLLVVQLHLDCGEPITALKTAEGARALVRILGDRQMEVTILELIIQAHIAIMSSEKDRAQQSWVKAMRAGKDALVIAKKLENRKFLADASFWVSQLYDMDSNFDESWKVANEARDIYRELDDNDGVACMVALMAGLSEKQNLFEQAWSLATEAVQLFKTTQNKKREEQSEDIRTRIKANLLPVNQVPASQPVAQAQPRAFTKLVTKSPQLPESKAAPKSKAVSSVREGTNLLDPTMAITFDMFQNKLFEVANSVLDLDSADEEFTGDVPLMAAGLTSSTAISMRDDLVQELPGFDIPVTLIFDYPTINDIVAFLDEQLKK